MIIWQGDSPIDGQPIMVIMTGLKQTSANPKTGRMLQVWIMRSDMHPQDAMKTSSDASICGNCIHRKNPTTGRRTCYVLPMPIYQVYQSWKDGNYPEYDEKILRKIRDPIRWGAYGDPVCIPLEIIERVHEITRKPWTGYTHQWHNNKFAGYKRLFHASCDNFEDFEQAKNLGWSTFQTLRKNESPIKNTQAVCQGGKKTTCEKCLLCSGTSQRQTHLTIPVHGNGQNYFM